MVQTDVKCFITKVELEPALKEYTAAKQAQYSASRLNGPAFDVYMGLSADDKKDFSKITEELLKEFEREQLNRQEAIQELDIRTRTSSSESAHTFAYKLTELVKLSYPTFDAAVRSTIAKDYFVRGLHPNMQIALKSSAIFSTKDIIGCADETVRLELAGVKSYSNKDISLVKYDVDSYMINSIADVVASKLNAVSINQNVQQEPLEPSAENKNSVNFAAVGNSNNSRRFNQRSRYDYNRRGRFSAGAQSSRQTRKCRSCQSTEHLI